MFLVFLLQSIFAQDASVFEVRKTLAMSEDQKVYHDYYISAGTSDGLKKNMLVTVKRNTPFRDTNLSKIEESLTVDVAVLELVHVQRTFSVARLKELTPSLVMEFSSVMIGDKIPLSSARMPSSTDKPLVKKVEAETKPAKKIGASEKPKPQVEVKANKSEDIKQPDVNISGEIPAAK